MAIKENDFINILKLIAPGTPIREGLENILKETRRVENMHKLVEKNGYDFNIPKLEETLIEKFQ